MTATATARPIAMPASGATTMKSPVLAISIQTSELTPALAIAAPAMPSRREIVRFLRGARIALPFV